VTLRVHHSGRYLILAVLSAALGIGLVWTRVNRAPEPPKSPGAHRRDGVARGAPPVTPLDFAPDRGLEGLARRDPPQLTSAVLPPAGKEVFDETRHPHPITPEHQRIFEENNRVGALNGAMDQGDFAALRRMNAAYRRDYPEDDQVLQEGYDLIADCLEQRSPAVIEAARRFWQTHRASTLRRHVRRHCLEDRPRQ
jgi:hypothetical protein